MVLRRKSLKLSSLSIPYLVKVGHFGYWKYPGARVRKPYPSGETYNLPKFRSKAFRGTTQPKEARALYNQPRSRAVLPPSTSEASYGLPDFRSKAVKQVPQPERAKPVQKESLPYKEPPPKLPEPVTPPSVQEVVRSTEEQRAPEVKPTAAKVRTESRAPSISLRRERRPEPPKVEEPPVEERKPSPPPEKKPTPRPAPEREVAPEPRVEERPPPRRVEAPREVEAPTEEAREVRRPERRRPAPPTEEPREELPPPEREAPPEERDPIQDLVEYVETISEDPEAPPEYQSAVDEIVRSAEAGNYANIPEIVNELPPDDNLTNLLDQIIEQYVPPAEREAPPPTEEPARVGRPVVPEVRPSRLREGEEPPPSRVSAEEAADVIATAQEGGVTPDSQRQVQTMLQEMPSQELVRLGEQLGSTGETPEELINDIMASAGAPPAEEERRAAREEFIDSYLNEVRSQIRSIAGGETDVRNAKDAKLTNNLIGDAIEAGDIDSALDAVDNYLVAVDPQGNDIKYNPLREIVARLGRLRQSELEAETREAQGGIPAERALGVAPEIRERVEPAIPTVGRGRIAEGRPTERRAEAEATPFPEAKPDLPTPEPELGRAETRRKLPSPEELRERYREKPKEVKLAPSPLPFKEPPPSISPLLGGLKSGLGDPLPTEDELKTATIIPLIPGSDVGQASTPVSKVTIGDRNYFIKESISDKESLNEILGSRLGDLVGVIVPKAAVINSPYAVGIIANWVDGKPLDLYPDPGGRVRSLPKDVVIRYILFGYLMGDSDAHYGQYMITADGRIVRVDSEGYFYRDEVVTEEEDSPRYKAARTIVFDNDLYTAIGGGSGASTYAERGMGNDFPIPHSVINDLLNAGPELVKILDEAGKTKAAQGVSQRLEWLSQIQDHPNPTIGDFLYSVLGWEGAKSPRATLREKIEAPVEQPYVPLQRKSPGQLLDYTESVRTILGKAWREDHNHRDMVRVALAFVKKVRRYMSDERSRNVIRVTERWLERRATDEEVDAANNDALEAYADLGDGPSYAAVALADLVGITETIAVGDAAGIAADAAAHALWDRISERTGASIENIRNEQRQIIRDLLGSPFLSDGDISPSVFRSEDVAGLARNIVAGGVTPAGTLKRTNVLPILADALEEAGLEETDILDDLRSPGSHHRGMWSLELVLRGVNKFQPTIREPIAELPTPNPLVLKSPEDRLDFNANPEELVLAASDLGAFQEQIVAVGLVATRQVWDRMRDQRSKNAIEAAENYLREWRRVSDVPVLDALADAVDASHDLFAAFQAGIASGVTQGAYEVSAAVVNAVDAVNTEGGLHLSRVNQSINTVAELGYDLKPIIFDILGSPYQPGGDLDPILFQTGYIKALATAAYNSGDDYAVLDNYHLLVLADALEEEGMSPDHPVLQHLRSSGPHYRGMWSLELVRESARKFSGVSPEAFLSWFGRGKPSIGPGPSDNYKISMPPEMLAETKAVDESGNPVTVYMGSEKPFVGKISPPSSEEFIESGIFVTDNKKIASTYGENILVANIYTKNPLDATKPVSVDEALRIALEFDKYSTLSGKAVQIRRLVDTGETDPFRWFAAVSGADQDTIGGATARQARGEYIRAMTNLGYDSVKHEDYDLPVKYPDGTERYATNWMVLYPSQIFAVSEAAPGAPTPPLARKGEPPIIMGRTPDSPPIEFLFNSSIVEYNKFTPELTEEVISYAEKFAKVVGRDSGLYSGYEAVLNDFSPEAGVPYHSYIVSRDIDGNINGLMLFQDYLISVPGQEAFYITNVLSHQPISSRLFRDAAREASSRDVPLVVAAKKFTFSDVEPADLAERVGIYSFDKQGNAVLLPQYAKVFAETGVVPNVLDKLNSFTKSVDLRKKVAGGRSDTIRKLKRDLRDVESQVRALEKIIRIDPLENNPENKSLVRQLNLEWKRIREQINHEEAPRTDAGRKVIEGIIKGASSWKRDTRDLPALPVFDPKTGKSRDLGVVGAFNEAVDFIDKIISKDVYDGPRTIKAKLAGETRSFYDSFDQSVNINPNSDAGVVVHEIFHFFANTIDNWERLCYEFMMSFAAGQVPESLKFLYPNSGYRENEFVRRIDIGYFTGSATWYLGKIYRDGTTEIPAMLGQALFNDPVGFCNSCPLGATFILALLLGELKNEIPWDEEESL